MAEVSTAASAVATTPSADVVNEGSDDRNTPEVADDSRRKSRLVDSLPIGDTAEATADSDAGTGGDVPGMPDISGMDENEVYELALRGFSKDATDEPDDDMPLRRLHVPRLDFLCVQHIAANFNEHPIIDQIPDQYVESVVARIDPASIDLPMTSKFVMSEVFWKHMSAQWPTADVTHHGSSWKRLYFEKMLQLLLERYHPSKSAFNNDDLMKKVEAARPFIHTVKLRELRSHVSLSKVFNGFFNLTTLDLTFGAPNLGMNYDKSEFGMKLSDAGGIATLLSGTKSLSNLMLKESLVNDELIGVLVKGLAKNQTMTSLDLSHNRIGNEGARKIAAVLEHENVLISLNLADNLLEAESGEYLAEALKTNVTLQELSLRLNNLGDSGGAKLLEGLLENYSLESLDLSANGLGQQCSLILLDVVKHNNTLSSIDVTCNDCVTGNGTRLLDALRGNPTITHLDIRENPSVTPEAERVIADVIYEREVEVESIRRQKFFAERAADR